MNPIFLFAFTIFLFVARISCDTCDTYVHPTYGKGQCIDQTLCPNANYISGYCESKPAGVKCCFSAPTSTTTGKTVQQAINEAGCNTGVVSTLAAQLVAITNRLQPGLISSITGVPGLSLSSAVQSVPYLQTSALNAIKKAIASRGTTMTVNSALRTLPQQLMLYKWYQMSKCGIPLAASPGRSNHEDARAVDIQDYSGWMSHMQNNACVWIGSSDPVHFTCPGVSLSGTSVKAFQQLWNCNNPTNTIPEDGIYGPNTESKILASPINGFPKMC